MTRFLRAPALGTIAAPLAWTAYIAIPVSGWGWLDGPPLGLIEAAAPPLIWWAWAAGRRLPGARTLVILVVAKIALAGMFVDRGFAARYYANETWTSPAERSIEFRNGHVTRRDDRVSFGTAGTPDLPLHFYNDVRFNFFQPTEPQRDRLAYSVEWDGFIRVDADLAPVTFYLDPARGVAGEISVDGRPVLGLDTGLRRSTPLTLEPGWHALRVRAQAKYGAGRAFEAGEIIGGTARPFDGRRVLLEPVGSVRLAIDRILRWTTRVADAAVLSCLALLVLAGARRAWGDGWRDVRAGRVLWLGAILEALVFAWRRAGGLIVLSGGDDWLAYESFGRAIALGDWIGAGQSGPFYYQPLYSYFLALTHLVFGDGLFGAVFVQRLLLAATVGWVAAITSELFGARASRIALVGGGVFLYLKIGAWSHVLLTEMLFLPLLMGWIAMLVGMARHGTSAARAATTGVLGGIATLTRSTLLLAWPPMLLLWRASLRARRGPLLAALLVSMTAVVGLATLRNWIVADRFVLVASSLGANLYLGNTPPHPLAPAPPERIAVYDRLGLEDNIRTVTEFALQKPGTFARGLWNKALYTVGFFRYSQLSGGSTLGTSWLYVGLCVLAAAGIARMLQGSPPAQSPALWLPAIAALTHFAVMVVIIPFGYADRYILPLYPPLIPYAAFAVEPFPLVFARLRAAAMVALTKGRRRAAPYATWAYARVFRLAMSVRRHPRDWLYLAYSAAILQRMDWRPEHPETTPLFFALLLPVIALAVARWAQRDVVHRVLGTALWSGALLHVTTRGSLSAEALHDPLFWGMLAVVAMGASALLGRWAVAALTAATTAGVCTAMAVLLPLFPDFERTLPRLDASVMRQSLTALVNQFGIVALICLLGVWIQAMTPGGTRGAATSRISAAARGALLAGLFLVLGGAWPAMNSTQWVVALAILLGLAEAAATKRSLRHPSSL